MIPKINFKLNLNREKIDLSFPCNTTANFGVVQPTFAREMVPNEKFTVQVGSVVRLAPLPVPTFGKMFLKHTHVYVPYIDVCPQFDAFLSGQNYKEGTQSTYKPTKLPSFSAVSAACYYIAQNSYITVYRKAALQTREWQNLSTNPQYDYLTWRDDFDSSAIARFENVLHTIRDPQTSSPFGGVLGSQTTSVYSPGGCNSLGGFGDDQEGLLLLGDNQYTFGAWNSNTSFSKRTAQNPTGNIFVKPADGVPDIVDIDTADFVASCGYYIIAYRLKPRGKRMRQIMLGLGYPFNPNLNAIDFHFNILKLLAFYKAWFNVFYPKRDLSFTDTKCYALIKYYAENGSFNLYAANTYLREFLDSLYDVWVYDKPDYFSISIDRPYVQDSGDITFPLYGNYDSPSSVLTSTSETAYSISATDRSTNAISNIRSSVTNQSNSRAQLPIYAFPIVEKLMHWTNKNSVIGKSIRNYLKVHYGIDAIEDVNNDIVQIIGSSEIPLNVSDILNTANTSEGYLGEFAGQSRTDDISEEFEFTAKKFGVWLTLTYVVPDASFYQGYNLENRAFDRLQLFTPEFDAAGYQLIERGEMSCDYPVSIDGRVANIIKPQLGYGFIPRYSHYKVPISIVNGDLSIRSLRNSMSPYVLNKMLPQESKDYAPIDNTNWGIDYDKDVSFYPTTVNQVIRKLSTDNQLGNFNRIFYYTGSDFDHFIINNFFKVTALAPMKSLSDSFDVNCDVTDKDNVVDLKHE